MTERENDQAVGEQAGSEVPAPERRQSLGCLIAFVVLLLMAVASPFVVSAAATVLACRDAHGGSC